MADAEKMKIPRRVYKYRDLGDYEVAPGLSNREVLRGIFVENKVWFASPATYNDPFDCRVQLSSSRMFRRRPEKRSLRICSGI